MNLVDVHCHLNHVAFKDDLEAVLKRAKEAGLKVILVSGVNPPANREVLKLAEKYPLIKASLGIYPLDALGLAEGETGLPRQAVPVNLEEEFNFFRKNKDQILALGEVGLDFYWDKKEHEKQKENFRKIIRFAKSLSKPLIIHSRKAEKECLDLLEEELSHQKIPVVLHCFSGNRSLIKRAADLGFCFSIPPNIVKLQHFQTLVGMVELTQLLTETDAPWLSPFSDQQNEPAFVVETIKKMAEIKKISPGKVAEQIWENYQKVFSKN